MTIGRQAVLYAAGLAALARWRWDPWPLPGEAPALDLVAHHDPGLLAALQAWHYAGPAAAALIVGSAALSLLEVWGPRIRSGGGAGALPRRPKPGRREPLVVLGEQHHPVEPKPSPRPSWLAIPAKGLYTGVAVFGAVGSGKTSGVMRPLADQVLSWRADDAERRASGLVLEVKGDFCHQVRELLEACGRGADYVEIGIGGSRSWNPLDIPEMDSYSLAWQLISVKTQLSGKSKEPFWDQAASQLVRWIIELHRLPPRDGWVTLRDLYHHATNLERFGEAVDAAMAATDPANSDERFVFKAGDLVDLPASDGWDLRDEGGGRISAKRTAERERALQDAGVGFELREAVAVPEGAAGRARDLHDWFTNHWTGLDSKLRTSISEGLASFLGQFTDPDVAKVFCPPAPGKDLPAGAPRPLPPMRAAIESGVVLALNMPANTAPMLARFAGAMLKTARRSGGRPTWPARAGAPGSGGRRCSCATSTSSSAPSARTTRRATRSRSP